MKAYIRYARNRNLGQLQDSLVKVLARDTSRLDVLQEVGKICYYQRNYKEAYRYYKKFTDVREIRNLDIYRGENAKIGYVMAQTGHKESAEALFNDFRDYAENDKTLYKDLSLSVYYSYTGDVEKALDHLRMFSRQDHFYYWIVVFLNIEPLIDNIRELPEFQEIYKELETNFWNHQKQMRISLERQELI